MNKLQGQLVSMHTVYFTAAMQEKFDSERQLDFSGRAWSYALMVPGAANGIVAPYPPVCWGFDTGTVSNAG